MNNNKSKSIIVGVIVLIIVVALAIGVAVFINKPANDNEEGNTNNLNSQTAIDEKEENKNDVSKDKEQTNSNDYGLSKIVKPTHKKIENLDELIKEETKITFSKLVDYEYLKSLDYTFGTSIYVSGHSDERAKHSNYDEIKNLKGVKTLTLNDKETQKQKELINFESEYYENYSKTVDEYFKEGIWIIGFDNYKNLIQKTGDVYLESTIEYFGQPTECTYRVYYNAGLDENILSFELFYESDNYTLVINGQSMPSRDKLYTTGSAVYGSKSAEKSKNDYAKLDFGKNNVIKSMMLK